jgi:ABC-type phosphate transport system auxiliary subunit
MSAGTLGYMMCDVYKIEKKQIAMDYEKQIKVLNEEIEKLRLEKLN